MVIFGEGLNPALHLCLPLQAKTHTDGAVLLIWKLSQLLRL